MSAARARDDGFPWVDARWEHGDSGQRRRYRGAPTPAIFRTLGAPGPTLRMALWEQPVSLDRRIDTLAELQTQAQPLQPSLLGAKVCTNWSVALLSFDSDQELALNRKKRKHKAGVI
jgi:hypothetical protein